MEENYELFTCSYTLVDGAPSGRVPAANLPAGTTIPYLTA